MLKFASTFQGLAFLGLLGTRWLILEYPTGNLLPLGRDLPFLRGFVRRRFRFARFVPLILAGLLSLCKLSYGLIVTDHVVFMEVGISNQVFSLDLITVQTGNLQVQALQVRALFRAKNGLCNIKGNKGY